MEHKFLILLVDADPSLLYVLNQAAWRTFPEASFIQVHSPTEAITYINGLDGNGPKLVFLNIDLRSDLTGFDFLNFLKAHAQGSLLPIIMLTTGQEPSRIEAAYSMGFSSYVIKPDDYEGWKRHFIRLRLYWLGTMAITQIQFQKLEYWK